MNITTTALDDSLEAERFETAELINCLKKIKTHIRRNIEKGSGKNQIVRLVMVNTYLKQLQQVA